MGSGRCAGVGAVSPWAGVSALLQAIAAPANSAKQRAIAIFMSVMSAGARRSGMKCRSVVKLTQAGADLFQRNEYSGF